MGLHRDYREDIRVIQGIVEKKMETEILDWGNIGIMETKMETTFIERDLVHFLDRTEAAT